jgi:hypothetical protein
MSLDTLPLGDGCVLSGSSILAAVEDETASSAVVRSWAVGDLDLYTTMADAPGVRDALVNDCGLVFSHCLGSESKYAECSSTIAHVEVWGPRPSEINPYSHERAIANGTHCNAEWKSRTRGHAITTASGAAVPAMCIRNKRMFSGYARAPGIVYGSRSDADGATIQLIVCESADARAGIDSFHHSILKNWFDGTSLFMSDPGGIAARQTTMCARESELLDAFCRKHADGTACARAVCPILHAEWPAARAALIADEPASDVAIAYRYARKTLSRVQKYVERGYTLRNENAALWLPFAAASVDFLTWQRHVCGAHSA